MVGSGARGVCTDGLRGNIGCFFASCHNSWKGSVLAGRGGGRPAMIAENGRGAGIVVGAACQIGDG